MLSQLLSLALQQVRERKFRRFEALCQEPRAAQTRLLRELIQRHGLTAHARRIGVPPDPNTDLETFRRAVPLTTYEDLAPEIDAAMRGEADQLAPGRPVFFAQTAGTSGNRKVIPITEPYRRAFQRPMHLFLWSLQAVHPRLTRHKVLYLVSPQAEDHSPAGVPIGAISGFNYHHMPKALQRFYAVPPVVFDIRNPEACTYAIARFALLHEVSFAVAITTWPLVELARCIEAHSERLLSDIEAGTFTPPAGMSDTERLGIASLLKPDPRRARLLRRRIAKAGEVSPAILWPSLEVVSCWYHASAGSALGALKRAWRPRAMRSALYSATEGWLNVPLRDGDPSGVAAIDSVLFEFEELDPDGQETGRTLLIDEVRPGVSYGLVITTAVGIWRYRLRDEVRVTGFFGRTPEFHFVQKLGAGLCAHHDLVIEGQFRGAVDALGASHPALSGVRWLVWVDTDAEDMPRYRYILAPEAGHGLDPAQLATEVDGHLRALNSMHGWQRDGGAIAPPRVDLLSDQALADWEATHLTRAGAAGNQAKPVQLVKDPSILPEAWRGPA